LAVNNKCWIGRAMIGRQQQVLEWTCYDWPSTTSAGLDVLWLAVNNKCWSGRAMTLKWLETTENRFHCFHHTAVFGRIWKLSRQHSTVIFVT